MHPQIVLACQRRKSISKFAFSFIQIDALCIEQSAVICASYNTQDLSVITNRGLTLKIKI